MLARGENVTVQGRQEAAECTELAERATPAAYAGRTSPSTAYVARKPVSAPPPDANRGIERNTSDAQRAALKGGTQIGQVRMHENKIAATASPEPPGARIRAYVILYNYGYPWFGERRRWRRVQHTL